MCICFCVFAFRAVSLTSCACGRESYYLGRDGCISVAVFEYRETCLSCGQADATGCVPRHLGNRSEKTRQRVFVIMAAALAMTGPHTS